MKLRSIEGINLLKRNEKMYANCCYLLSSESVAKNMYFRSKTDVGRAHKMFRKHLLPVMNILDYLITPNGWLLMVRIKSEEEIINNIRKKKELSRKLARAIKQKDIPIILSESIRNTISAIAIRHNTKNERLGTLVSRNFSRFIFEDIESAELVMHQMKNEQIDLCWQRKRYRVSNVNFDNGQGYSKIGDIFMCTKKIGGGITGDEFIDKCLRISRITINVLHEIINFTNGQYFPKKMTENYPIKI